MAEGELDFSVTTICREIDELAHLAQPFLDPTSLHIVQSWSTNLRSLARNRRTEEWAWSISESNPIKTRLTDTYEPQDRRGPQKVWGELCFTWTIILVRPGPKATFSLRGNASSKIYIKMRDQGGGTTLVGQWQFEIGDSRSPGCHFHVGLCRDNNDLLFPHWLTVPRLPSLLIMPADALDFLLGELFQKAWKHRVSAENDHTRTLGASQRDRLTRLLRWKLDQVSASSGSAWNWLKHRHPPPDLFATE